MNINATLIVQAVNFFIAYLLFRFILLKPAYYAIEQEQAYHESLQEQVEQGQEQFYEKQKQQKKQWLRVHQFYQKNKPIVPDSSEIFQGLCPPLTLDYLSDKERALLIEKAATSMAKHIGNN